MALLWTSTTDVTDRWVGGEVPATDSQLDTLLEDAEDTMLAEFPDLATRIARADGTDTTEGPSVPLYRVQKVAARVVIRHLRNPGGIRSMQQGAGPFQETMTYGGEEPGAMYLTDRDRADLGGHKVGGAFTIDTTPTGTDAVTIAPDPWTVVT